MNKEQHSVEHIDEIISEVETTTWHVISWVMWFSYVRKTVSSHYMNTTHNQTSIFASVENYTKTLMKATRLKFNQRKTLFVCFDVIWFIWRACVNPIMKLVQAKKRKLAHSSATKGTRTIILRWSSIRERERRKERDWMEKHMLKSSIDIRSS